MEKLCEMIANQQKGKENTPAFMIGEQLKDMARVQPGIVELLKQDLEVPEMSLESAAKKLQEYADKNHGKANSFCITPKVAEDILRKFYGLPAPAQEQQEQAPTVNISSVESSTHIDLSDFL